MDEQPLKKRNPLPMAALLLLAVIVPFLAWYGSWFGRELTDSEITASLELDQEPRDIQHALLAVQSRLLAGDSTATRWRSQVIALKGIDQVQVRRMVAWVLGHDMDDACRDALVGMLGDADLATRRNAAVALTKWQDERSRPILLAALQPIEIRAPRGGTLDLKVVEGDPVGLGRDMAIVETSGDVTISLRPPIDGRVLRLDKKDGESVTEGELLGALSPDPQSVLAALKGLYLVGRKEDADAVRPFANGAVQHMTDQVTQQAKLTLDRLEAN
jgi:biotin carboxyl carrier protein